MSNLSVYDFFTTRAVDIFVRLKAYSTYLVLEPVLRSRVFPSFKICSSNLSS
jgi:hypothetical protein